MFYCCDLGLPDIQISVLLGQFRVNLQSGTGQIQQAAESQIVKVVRLWQGTSILRAKANFVKPLGYTRAIDIGVDFIWVGLHLANIKFKRRAAAYRRPLGVRDQRRKQKGRNYPSPYINNFSNIFITKAALILEIM